MEVHKHPHHVLHSKRWTEYLLEFFMLFLAVFLGFIAENVRENLVERHREKEYIESLINDIKTDTTKLGRNLNDFDALLLGQDTLKKAFAQLDNGITALFERSFYSTSGFPDFVYTDATIQQLKNSGGFRLIRNLKVIEKIMAYDAEVKKAQINEAFLGRALEKMDEATDQIINMQSYFDQRKQGKTSSQMEAEHMDILLTHDKLTLSRHYNRIVSYNGICKTVKRNMQHVKEEATRLIQFLQKEYHLTE